jgi:hypothetical protein
MSLTLVKARIAARNLLGRLERGMEIVLQRGAA